MAGSDPSAAIRFGAFLISGSLFLIFGIEFLISGITQYVLECVEANFPLDCTGTALWNLLSPIIGGTVTIVLGAVLYLFAYRLRRPPPASVVPVPSPPT
jgi:hypothetical protein